MKKLLFTIAISLSLNSFSQNNGSLDPTFDNDGLFDNYYPGSGIKTMAQPNGDVIFVYKDKFGESFICKLNSAGAIDNTFGVASGSNAISSGNSFDVNDAVQSGNHFISCGRINLVAGIASFSTTGFEVTSFGASGYTTIPSAGIAFHCIEVQADGKLVMGGELSNFATVSRVLPNGTIDTGFGTNGTMSLSPTVGQTYLKLFGIAIESNGKIILTGEKTYSNNIVRSYTVRLNSNGTLDATFGTGGAVELTLPYDFSGTNRVMPYTGNSYILSGSAYMTSGSSDFLVIKLNSNGTYDASFGASSGYSTFNMQGHELSEGLCKQSDGQILVGGYTSNSSTATSIYVSILRLNPNGSMDASFGNNAGYYTFNVPSYANTMAFNLAIDQLDRIYTTGGGGLCGPDQCYSGFVMVSRHDGSEPMGVNELKKNINSPLIFPNPASSFINIKNETQADKLVMYDVNGRILLCNELYKETTTLDLRTISPGIYTCVLLKGGLPVMQEKVVVLPSAN